MICHAHPRHGGSKDHPILWALRNELASRGFVVLAFNFRGTMRSAGTYGAGHAETKDVRAAIGRVREESEGPTIVCGWSFGANVALREALTDERVGALALIGLPLEPADIEIPPTPGRSSSGPSRAPPCWSPGRGRLLPAAAARAVPRHDAGRRGRDRPGHRPLPVAPREGGRRDGGFVRRTRAVLGIRRELAPPVPPPPPDAAHHEEREEHEREPEQPGNANTRGARTPSTTRSTCPASPTRVARARGSVAAGRSARSRPPPRTRTRGAGSARGAHRHPGYGSAESGEQLAREPDALTLEIGDERRGVERGLGRADARRHAALGKPANRRCDRDRGPERTRRQALGGRLEARE